MPSEPHDHHYVPRFLLSGWCGPNGKLTTYFRPRTELVVSELNPKSTAYERDLYSYQLLPPDRSQVIETSVMRPIDDAAAPVLRKTLNLQLPDLTAEERSDFTRFVLSLRARHPDAIAMAHERGPALLLANLDENPEEYLAARGASQAPTLRDWVQQNAPHIVPNFGLSVIPAVIADEATGRRVWSMPWWTIDVRQASRDLLIGDRPCILEGDARAGKCVIAVPLSPTMALFISNDEQRVAAVRRLSKTGFVKMLNRATITYAKERVYGTGPGHLPLIRRFLRHRSS